MNRDSMTQVLSQTRKITCAGVRRTCGLSVVFTVFPHDFCCGAVTNASMLSCCWGPPSRAQLFFHHDVLLQESTACCAAQAGTLGSSRIRPAAFHIVWCNFSQNWKFHFYLLSTLFAPAHLSWCGKCSNIHLSDTENLFPSSLYPSLVLRADLAR